jgi:predicted nucleic acid-binding protein
MSANYFIDTNIVLYLFDKDKTKSVIAQRLFTANAVVSPQVLAETANVLTRKFNFDKKIAMESLCFIRNNVQIVPFTAELFDIVSMVFTRYSFSFYDSMIIASALSSNCSKLYSEDFQHKQKIEKKLTIINPFL